MYVDENEEPLSEYEKQLMENRLELDALIKKELEKPEIVDCFNAINSYTVVKKTSSVKRRREVGDSPFKFSGMIPVERRTSSRLAKVTPTYNFDDAYQELEKQIKTQRLESLKRTRPAAKTVTAKSSSTTSDDGIKSRLNLLDDLSEPIFLTKRKITGDLTLPPPTIPIEMIDDDYLGRVAKIGSHKIYSEKEGTLCHHCRQKTVDTKTICRSNKCIAARGQFCGICLHKHYDEDAKSALKDPNWHCPPCRNICKCSICSARKADKKVLSK